MSGLAVRALRRLAATVGFVNPVAWRVGHVSAPLDFVPRSLCSWAHRFDDPQRAYRTLYCARRPETALREVLADLRPQMKTRADFERFQLAQGIASTHVMRPAADVTVAWRRENSLAAATVARNGPFADLNSRDLLERLADTHANLLAEHGMPQLDLTQITSKSRAVTQTISRDLFDRGAAGVLFRSNLDGQPCAVLFEGRARLRADGRIVPMTDDHPALLQVCSEYRLVLCAVPRHERLRGAWRP